MINIELNDLLVFEDEAGNMYQGCVCEINNCKDGNVYKLNNSIYKENKFIEELIVFNYKYDAFINDYVFNIDKENTYRLKEIWRKTDEDTYKRIWKNDRE